MKQFWKKLLLVVLAFLAVNGWLIGKGAAKGAASFLGSAAFEETLLFVLLQAAVLAVCFVQPPEHKGARIALLCISEILVAVTVIFWGFVIVGPIWLN